VSQVIEKVVAGIDKAAADLEASMQN
jgi:hypothetical protein